MVVYVRNPKLKKRIFKSINRYSDLAIKAYGSGKMSLGKKYEGKSDRLYRTFYHKMFKVVRK